MKAADIVGKRVAQIKQEIAYRADTGEAAGWAIREITFEDGSYLTFSTVELGYSYATKAEYWPAPGRT